MRNRRRGKARRRWNDFLLCWTPNISNERICHPAAYFCHVKLITSSQSAAFTERCSRSEQSPDLVQRRSGQQRGLRCSFQGLTCLVGVRLFHVCLSACVLCFLFASRGFSKWCHAQVQDRTLVFGTAVNMTWSWSSGVRRDRHHTSEQRCLGLALMPFLEFFSPETWHMYAVEAVLIRQPITLTARALTLLLSPKPEPLNRPLNLCGPDKITFHFLKGPRWNINCVSSRSSMYKNRQTNTHLHMHTLQGRRISHWTLWACLCCRECIATGRLTHRSTRGSLCSETLAAPSLLW